MKKYGFVASGGGYRSFYTEGALVWLRENDYPIVHITSTSSGNNIVLDYLLWDWGQEELPPVLSKTLRLSVRDIFYVFSSFLGLKPALIPNGTHLFTVDKDKCRKSLLLDEAERRKLLAEHLKSTTWHIFTTNLSRRKGQDFRVNDVLANMDDAALGKFMDVFLAGITTIPYFKAITMDGDYFMEGGYLDNTPLRTLFEDPQVEEIIAVDFTDCDYHAKLKEAYDSHTFTLPVNSIDMYLLVSDIELNLPNTAVLSQATRLNRILEKMNQPSIEIEGKTYYHKPVHVLRPKNLESMTVSLKHSRIQKEYYERGRDEIADLVASF